MNNAQRNLERRLDRHAIQQLRDEVSKLHELLQSATEKLEDAERRADFATEDACFWQDHSHDLLAELNSNDSTSPRTVEISQAGELSIVKSGESENDEEQAR